MLFATARELSMAVALLGVGLAGCHESDIEPRSPIDDDWALQDTQRPVLAMSQDDIPLADVSNPCPLPAEPPRVINLGTIGDAPLTQVHPPHRWPWSPEPFHIEGYPYGIRSYYGARYYAWR